MGRLLFREMKKTSDILNVARLCCGFHSAAYATGIPECLMDHSFEHGIFRID